MVIVPNMKRVVTQMGTSRELSLNNSAKHLDSPDKE
jgi:hypothetical protein